MNKQTLKMYFSFKMTVTAYGSCWFTIKNIQAAVNWAFSFKQQE